MPRGIEREMPKFVYPVTFYDRQGSERTITFKSIQARSEALKGKDPFDYHMHPRKVQENGSIIFDIQPRRMLRAALGVQ